jgi:hypothetical protein
VTTTIDDSQRIAAKIADWNGPITFTIAVFGLKSAAPNQMQGGVAQFFRR